MVSYRGSTEWRGRDKRAFRASSAKPSTASACPRTRYAPGYLVAQVIGAILAAGILLLIAKGGPAPYDPAVAGFAANGYGEHSPGRYNLTAAFLVEVVLTAVLVLTVLGATAVEAPVGFAGIPSAWSWS